MSAQISAAHGATWFRLIMPDKRIKPLLVAAGAPRDEAEIVIRHSIDANLAGHDSHGIMQIPTYIDRMTVGHIVPGRTLDHRP